MPTLISLESSPLSQKVASLLGQQLILFQTRRFSNGEFFLQLDAVVDSNDVILLNSVTDHDSMICLLLAVRFLKQNNASHITVISPYFPYGRQQPEVLQMMLELFLTAGAHRLIIVDCHQPLPSVPGLSIKNILPSMALPQGDWLMASPDRGGQQRVQNAAEALGCNYMIMTKTRVSQHKMEFLLQENVIGSNCLIVDDIIDSGDTICKAASFLMEHGAISVHCFATHPVLSHSSAINNIDLSCLSSVYVTDSLTSSDGSKLRVVSLAEQLFAEIMTF